MVVVVAVKTLGGIERMKPVLDVGCGSYSEGNISLDLYTGKTDHHRYNIDPEKLPNFTIGDACHLPYRINSIKVLIASNLIEHLIDPLTALREFKQVSEIVIIRVPNNPLFRDHPKHYYSWSKPALRNFLGTVFDDVKVYSSTRYALIEHSMLFKKLNHSPLLGKFAGRLLGTLIGVELIAVCR